MQAAVWCAVVFLTACTARTPITIQSLTAQARAEQPSPPSTPLAQPLFMSQTKKVDAALANISIEQVTLALAPLRGEATQVTPTPPSAAVLAARAQCARGEMDAAVRGLAEYVRSAPNDLQAWREIARMLDAAGRRDLAAAAWSRLLVTLPLDAEALGSGGIDAAGARQPLVACERLLKLRQMQRLGEAPQQLQGIEIAQTVALGLSLRELGYVSAAAHCLREVANESLRGTGAQDAAITRQAADLQRIAGECYVAAGAMQEASECFQFALTGAGVEDRVSLPRLVWSLCAQGRNAAAALACANALQNINAPGRAGVPQAMALLASAGQEKVAFELLLGESDRVAARTRVVLGTQDALGQSSQLPVDDASSRLDLTLRISGIAERNGLSKAIDQACQYCAAYPWNAADMAIALRCIPAPPSLIRQALHERLDASAPPHTTQANTQVNTQSNIHSNAQANTTTNAVHAKQNAHDTVRTAARLLAAQFELQGGEAEAAYRLAQPLIAGENEPLRAVAVYAAAAMEDAARVEQISKQPVACAQLAAAFAEAFAALGNRSKAEQWSERAIAIDAQLAQVWVARSKVDLVPTPGTAEARATEARAAPAQARLSAERAWEAESKRFEGTRRMLELSPADKIEQSELYQLLRQQPTHDVALRELNRFDAIRRGQQGQGEPVLESLRALLLEDATDSEVAVVLVTASAAASQLPETEIWLEALRARRPASPALLEALVSVKARQGRLTEGVQALRDASVAQPESAARRRAWARGLSIAGRNEQAYSVIAPEGDFDAGPRALLERAEFAARAERNGDVLEDLQRVQALDALTEAQQLTALSLALRLSKERPERRELLANIGARAMLSADAGPAALSAAMLGGSMQEAVALAQSKAQGWSAVASCESAQRLLDEQFPRRALALLAAIEPLAQRGERRAIRRAQIAIMAQIDDVVAARQLSEDSLREGMRPFLSDTPEASDAKERNELAGCFMLADHLVSAEQLFSEAIKTDPNFGEAFNNLAWLRMLRGEINDTTRDLVQRALALQPNDTSVLDTAGWLAYLQPDQDANCEKALQMLQRATMSADASLEALDHYGDALWCANQREHATRVWRQVVEAAAGRGSRAHVIEAFDRMQQRLWGVRAWQGHSFYDARDGAAIARAQAKLQAIAQDQQPPVVARHTPTATVASPDTNASADLQTSTLPLTLP